MLVQPPAAAGAAGAPLRLSDSARPAPHPDVTAVPLDDEVVLYVRGDDGHVLNPTATYVWALCDGERTVASVAKEIAGFYDIDYGRALSDVRELLESLDDAGALSW